MDKLKKKIQIPLMYLYWLHLIIKIFYFFPSRDQLTMFFQAKVFFKKTLHNPDLPTIEFESDLEPVRPNENLRGNDFRVQKLLDFAEYFDGDYYDPKDIHLGLNPVPKTTVIPLDYTYFSYKIYRHTLSSVKSIRIDFRPFYSLDKDTAYEDEVHKSIFADNSDRIFFQVNANLTKFFSLSRKRGWLSDKSLTEGFNYESEFLDFVHNKEFEILNMPILRNSELYTSFIGREENFFGQKQQTKNIPETFPGIWDIQFFSTFQGFFLKNILLKIIILVRSSILNRILYIIEIFQRKYQKILNHLNYLKTSLNIIPILRTMDLMYGKLQALYHDPWFYFEKMFQNIKKKKKFK